LKKYFKLDGPRNDRAVEVCDNELKSNLIALRHLYFGVIASVIEIWAANLIRL